MWVMCTHNTLTSSATGLSSFGHAYVIKCLFSQGVSCTSIQALTCCCKWTWAQTFPFWMEYQKLVSKFVGPFTIQRTINPAAVWLKHLCFTRIHAIFHVSNLQSVHRSLMVPGTSPPCLTGGSPAYSSWQSLWTQQCFCCLFPCWLADPLSACEPPPGFMIFDDDSWFLLLDDLRI